LRNVKNKDEKLMYRRLNRKRVKIGTLKDLSG
jgi:hypothetical protein